MNSKYPIEALLRPIYEFYIVGIWLFTAVIFFIWHNVFLLSLNTVYILNAFIIALAFYRFKQGYRVYSYQKGLIKLPVYSLEPEKIPVSVNYLFLGKGFSWEQKHAQRVEDTKQSKNKEFVQPSKIFRYIRRKEKTSSIFYTLFHNNHYLNLYKPLPDVGGNPILHAVGLLEGETDIYEPLTERVGHKLVLGTTRVGKTRFAEILLTQDIRRGDTTIVFDPKGDADLMLRTYVEAKKANRPVYVFHLGFPEISCRYNAIGTFTKITEVATRVSDQLPSSGNSAVFKDFAWGFINIVARALVKAGERPNFIKIKTYINDINPLIKLYRDNVLIKNDPSLAETIQNLIPNKVPAGKDPECFGVMLYHSKYNVNDPELEGILAVFKHDKAYYSKLIASLRPLLDKLTSGDVAEILSPSENSNDRRPIIDWTQIIRQNAVVYVGLDALTDAQVASAVGASMFADLTSIAGKLYKHGAAYGLPKSDYKHKVISIHADEFNELVKDQFIPMINKAGGANFQITAYTQSSFDIEAGIGDKAKAGVIFDNFNTLVMLRVKSKETADILISKVPEYDIHQLTSMSQSTDSAQPGNDIDFISSTREQITTQKLPAVSVNDLLNLPKGQAYIFMKGGQLKKIRLPIATKEKFSEDSGIPNKLEEMAIQMRQSYHSTMNIPNEAIPIATNQIKL